MDFHVPEFTSRTALVVIDVQQGFNDPAWGRRNNPDAEGKMAELISAWRRSGRQSSTSRMTPVFQRVLSIQMCPEMTSKKK